MAIRKNIPQWLKAVTYVVLFFALLAGAVNVYIFCTVQRITPTHRWIALVVGLFDLVVGGVLWLLVLAAES